ncbi:MAG TPA: hypothetical protein VKA67_09210 [Verrucomicrobiae bacterium]|nr:hypothetical protein [Verrucomicrobiae bacterium]
MAKNSVDQGAGEIATVMRGEHFIAPQGWRVCKKHPCLEIDELPDEKHKPLFLCVDVADAEPDEMRETFQFGKKLIMGDGKLLRTDIESNSNNHLRGRCFKIYSDVRDRFEKAGCPMICPGF